MPVFQSSPPRVTEWLDGISVGMDEHVWTFVARRTCRVCDFYFEQEQGSRAFCTRLDVNGTSMMLGADSFDPRGMPVWLFCRERQGDTELRFPPLRPGDRIVIAAKRTIDGREQLRPVFLLELT